MPSTVGHWRFGPCERLGVVVVPSRVDQITHIQARTTIWRPKPKELRRSNKIDIWSLWLHRVRAIQFGKRCFLTFAVPTCFAILFALFEWKPISTLAKSSLRMLELSRSEFLLLIHFEDL
jgi:hypothetical protein